MKLNSNLSTRRYRVIAGYSLVEMLFSMGVGAILLLNMDVLYVFGMKSFVCMANYDLLDASSCNTLDIFSKSIRGATAVIAYEPNQSITLTNALAGQGTTIRYDPTTRTVVSTVTGQATRTNLTGCDSWSFSLYTRAPNITSTDVTFNPATSAASCKLVQMNWHCTKTIIGLALTTESVQTAQIVLRNKTN